VWAVPDAVPSRGKEDRSGKFPQKFITTSFAEDKAFVASHFVTTLLVQQLASLLATLEKGVVQRGKAAKLIASLRACPATAVKCLCTVHFG
jgi:hypothetical protein